MSPSLPKYDCAQSYQWNYDNVPVPRDLKIPDTPGNWQFCGHQVNSPLGIPAGPLLNGRWCLYYAALGFDVLTYKTVRSCQRDCYPMPNLQPVSCGQMNGTRSRVPPIDSMQGTWAVAFGMPSTDPDTWRRDIEWTRQQLPDNKLLTVSVVGTMQDGWGIEELAADYARCAKWAVDSGADCVETNFSCPNVNTCDGQLYLDVDQCSIVSEAVKSAVGALPLIIKVGHFMDHALIPMFLAAVDAHAAAISMTNSIASTVGVSDRDLMFERQQRGICGRAILDASIAQVRKFANEIQKMASDTQIVGLGGIETATDVTRYLDAGAAACHIATHAMIEPGCAIKIRQDLSQQKAC